MIVCLCEGLTERAVVDHVRSGASTVRALARSTRAGTHCGACTCDLRRIVRRERTASAEKGSEALALAAK